MPAKIRNTRTSLNPSQRRRRSFLERTAMLALGAVTATLSKSIQATENASNLDGQRSCSAKKSPMQHVEGKVAFITGGSSGVGLGIAQAFLAAGMKVVFSYRTKLHQERAMDTLRPAVGRVHSIELDVSDRRAMELAATETIRKFGKIHALVNNAGVLHHAPVSTMSYEDWDWVMNVNVHGVFNGVRSFLPLIQSHDEGGHIITTSSIAGMIASALSYTTSKFAVVGMMEALRLELGESNIGVSVYCPGIVRSNIDRSSRNRPGTVTGEASPSTGNDSPPDSIFQNPLEAMDPLKAGQLVLRGMRNNDLYIFSHPEYESVIGDRCNAILASFPRDLHPTNPQLERARALRSASIYGKELERRRCGNETRRRIAR